MSIIPLTGTTAAQLAVDQAAGLRALADLIEANPELTETFRNGLSELRFFAWTKAEVTAVARAAARAGLAVSKEYGNEYFRLYADVSPAVRVKVLAERATVCERVVTGTREVTEEVPDPKAPTITRTRVVEDIEWRCIPLLAAVDDGEGS